MVNTFPWSFVCFLLPFVPESSFIEKVKQTKMTNQHLVSSLQLYLNLLSVLSLLLQHQRVQNKYKVRCKISHPIYSFSVFFSARLSILISNTFPMYVLIKPGPGIIVVKNGADQNSDLLFHSQSFLLFSRNGTRK